MKSIAPQGEWLTKRILGGNKEIAIIFMGANAEKHAKNFLSHLPFTMYLPFKTSPFRFSWPVHNCEVYLVDTSVSSESFLKSFVMNLFLEGASLIHYLSSKINQTFTRN